MCCGEAVRCLVKTTIKLTLSLYLLETVVKYLSIFTHFKKPKAKNKA
jgi:hypothetical protein